MISEDFYKYALKLFKEAGYINQYNPIYINHSSEQFIYFDTKEHQLNVDISRILIMFHICLMLAMTYLKIIFIKI